MGSKAKPVPIRDLLQMKDFNPLSLDISNIQNFSDQIPEDGIVDIANAESLGMKSLRMSDHIGELLGQLTRYVAYKEGSVSVRKAEAFEKLESEEVKTTVQQHRYGSNEEYKKAIMVLADAKGVKDWLQKKYDYLIRLHYHCKDLLRTYDKGKNASERDETYPDDEDNFGS